MIRDILAAIGNTPLVELTRVVPRGGARVVVKLESTNPTGSMKDRMARAVIEAAARDGRLRPGGTAVEYTSGTTGISLALVCAALGYRLKAVSSDAFSEEKRRTMRAFGAEVIEVASDGRRINRELIETLIARSKELAREPGHWWVDQLTNADAIAGYHPLGVELWQQSDGGVDAFVQAVGTAHSIQGVAFALRRYSTDVEIVAVEPAESPVLSGGAPGSHRIEGIGIGFLPPLWDPSLIDAIEAVSSTEGDAMARRLAREEGVFTGTSSGANVVAALRVAQRLGPGATVATLVIDSGLRYLSNETFA